MATNAEKALEELQGTVGDDEGAGEWFEVTQDLINTFADATHDHQWIHVDPERCEQMSPWKKPIAHGFLTLSMLTHLSSSIPRTQRNLDGVMMGINYGFDKVRFVSPVTVGSRIRAKSTVGDVSLKDPNTVQVTRNITVEIEGEQRPALVSAWLTLLAFS